MLAKDLAEMAQRRRTYVVRVAFTLLVFSMSVLVFISSYGAARFSPKGLLGQGGRLLIVLYETELVGLCLFVPAIVSGAVAAEKERNTLQLLFVTQLRPWDILIEKLLSRLVPVATFLLVSLPLLFVGYLMGGLSVVELEFAMLGLALTAFQVACISLFCSAFCATSATAFVMSYVTMATLFAFPYLVVSALVAFEMLHRKVTGTYPGIIYDWLDQPRWQPAIHMALTSTQGFSSEWLFRQPIGPGGTRPFHRQFLPLCVITMSGLCFLLLARLVIVKRAVPQPKHRMRRLFQSLDRGLIRINDRFGRGIVFGQTGEDLPALEPVAWRESRRGNLGRFNYMIRILLILELPILLPMMVYVVRTRDVSFSALGIPGLLFWSIALLVVFVRAAGLIAAEKARQTLDVLLTTPVSFSGLAGAKLRGMRRAMAIVSVPILVHAILVDSLRTVGGQPYLLETIVNLVLLLILAAQLAFLFGLVSQTQGRAVTLVLSLFVAWCSLPILIHVFAGTGAWLLYFSPISGLLLNQFSRVSFSQPLPGVFTRPLADTGYHAFIHYMIYVPVVITIIWVNHGVARQVLLRPRTFSRAPTHHAGLFLED